MVRGLALALLALSLGGGGLAAQEVRFSLSQGAAGFDELGYPQGLGWGVRYVHPRGIGVALDFDRMQGTPAPRRLDCPPGQSGSACTTVRADANSSLELTTFLVFLDLGETDRVHLRLGGGRSAGVARGREVLRSSGAVSEYPSADLGKGRFAWSRGADGTLIAIEFLRLLPMPGPLPLHLQVAYRHHFLEMGGCLVGELSPFCGHRSIHEFQGGLTLGLRATRR